MLIGELLEGASSAYATVAKINHEIKWWAIILLSMIIRSAYVFLSNPALSRLSPPLQKAAANLLNLTIVICIMLVFIQFAPFWMPLLENGIEYIGDLF